MKQLAKLALLVAAVAACKPAEPTGRRQPAIDQAMLGTTAIAAAPVAHVGHGTQPMMAAPRGLEAIVLGVAGCPVEDFQVASTCDGMRALAAGTRTVDAESASAVGTKLVAHASPAVRIQAAQLLVTSGTANSHDAIVDAGLRERDASVLRAFVHVLAQAPSRPSRAAQLFLAAADHADPAVRREAVSALVGGQQTRAASPQPPIAGAAAKLAALIERDRDPSVRRAACANAGKLGDDALLPTYRQVTETAASDPALYAACMEGVVAMFHDHPSFGTASEGAYHLFLERIAAQPRSEASPPWTVMSAFCYLTHEPDLDKLAAWRTRATWFDTSAVKRAIVDVVADRAASWQARTAGIESLVGLGATQPELAALKRGLVATDDNDRRVLAKLDSVLAH